MIRETALRDLQKLDAGSWKGRVWAGERLPSLDEVVAGLPPGKRCFIEIQIRFEARCWRRESGEAAREQGLRS